METTTVHFAPAPGPLDNPLKGWATYTDVPLYQPYSMVYRYIAWRDLEPRPGEYQFAEWEAKTWTGAAAEGRHVIFRVYIDFPGQRSGLPDWLRDAGVKETSYTDIGGGVSPDYENPQLVAALERLIAALGARYDKHPRIAFVAAGLLGHWGEWHTYPNPALFASVATQRRVVDAYRAAFPNKKVMFRYAKDYVGQQAWAGFHDDYFPEDTGVEQDWYFLSYIRRAGRGENWRRSVIGGEMIPEKGKNALKWLGNPTDFAFTLQRATDAHFTWIGPYSPAMEAPPNAAFDANCQTLVRRMGYQFRWDRLTHDAVLRPGRPFTLELLGANEGVAPFYYPWPVQIALLDTSGRCVAQIPTPIDIRQLQPGTLTVHIVANAPRVPSGRYTLTLGILDPLTNRPAIRWANRLPAPPSEGWIPLSTVTVA